MDQEDIKWLVASRINEYAIHFLMLDLGSIDLEEVPREINYTRPKRLFLNNTKIKNIDYIPPSVIELDIGESPVESIVLPPKLWRFYGGNTELTTLENIPETTKQLVLRGCKKLETLPKLPRHLDVLNVHGTALHELPDIPETVISLYTDDTPNLPADFPRYPIRGEVPNPQYCQRVRDWQSRRRVISRTRAFKEDLMRAVWHPERVERMWTPEQFDHMIGAED